NPRKKEGTSLIGSQVVGLKNASNDAGFDVLPPAQPSQWKGKRPEIRYVTCKLPLAANRREPIQRTTPNPRSIRPGSRLTRACCRIRLRLPPCGAQSRGPPVHTS